MIYRITIESVREEAMYIEAATPEEAKMNAQKLLDFGQEVIDLDYNRGEPANTSFDSISEPLSAEDLSAWTTAEGNAEENAAALDELDDDQGADWLKGKEILGG